jgi:peptidoglycan/LPS O-acetylase OafA/YrhL
MTETHPPRRVLRSIGAVLAGFLATAILSIATDLVLHAAGIFPAWGQPMSDALFVLATAYRIVFTIAGGYITARLAPNRPMAHVLVLGFVGLMAAVAGTLATWNKGPEFGPKWYPLALVVTALPCVWAGGKLAQLRNRSSSPTSRRGVGQSGPEADL